MFINWKGNRIFERIDNLFSYAVRGSIPRRYRSTVYLQESSMKKTIVIGATTNRGRYAHQAAELLHHYGHEIVPIGIRKGQVMEHEILDLRTRPAVADVDTVTLYVGPHHQPEWYDYIINLRPKRIIFNPGTENPEFERLAASQGIEVLQACTLVMLRSGQY